MKHIRIGLILGAAALVLGCEARIGKGDDNMAANEQASAEGKAKEGQIAFSMPGFDVKMDVPLDKAKAENEGKIIYPGSKVTGIYIAAHPDAASGSDGEVELRFATADPPDKVAAWYRDPARAPNFSLGSESKDGAAFLFTGTRRDGDGSFKLRLEPKGSGTDGRLAIRDKS